MKRKILLGDDDAPVRIMVARVLTAAGYDVMHVGGASEAVAELRSARPDLVLLDLKTPDRAGWQPFEEIKRLDPTVPVIATAAWSNQYEQAARRGIDALLEKPLDLPLLLDLVCRLTGESAQSRSERNRKTGFLDATQAAA